MGIAHDSATLNGLTKIIFGKDINEVIPDGVQLYKEVPMPKDEELGRDYRQPAILSDEHGFTYTTTADGLVTLNASIPFNMKEAIVEGNQMYLRSIVSYQMAAKASTGDGKAFKAIAALLYKNMVNSFAKRVEINMFYGGDSIGAQAGAPAANVITISAASFAPGIWANAVNMVVDIYTAAGVLVTAGLIVKAVDIDARTVEFTGAPGSADTDVIVFAGSKAKESLGVKAILSTSGSLFGIDNSVYSLWKGSSYDAGSADLTFTKLQKAIAKAVGKGLDEDVDVFVSDLTWANLINDQAALRKYDSSYSKEKAENGSKAIVFYSSNGMVRIRQSIFVKRGEAFVLPIKRLKRIGATDITFRVPGRGEDEFFLHRPDQNGYELRAMSDMALFIEKPARCVYIYGIVNS
jgi:hypothetical protein